MSNSESQSAQCFFWQLPYSSGQLKITTLKGDMKGKKKNKLENDFDIFGLPRKMQKKK